MSMLLKSSVSQPPTEGIKPNTSKLLSSFAIDTVGSGPGAKSKLCRTVGRVSETMGESTSGKKRVNPSEFLYFCLFLSSSGRPGLMFSCTVYH